MRLTIDLIEKSTTFLNALKEREIDLRGNKIPIIENLGATHDQHDTMDLSDNAIKKVENFPYLKRLKALLLHNNNINKIEDGLELKCPLLDTLILNNNGIENLKELLPLQKCVHLRTLSLLENPVTKKEHYRLFIIYKLPFLKVLDFTKITLKERKQSASLFQTEIGKSILLS